MCSIDLITPIVDIVCKSWNCTAPCRSLILDLEDNLEALGNSRNELLRMSNDMLIKVKSAESQHQKRSDQVDGWFKDVEAIAAQVQQILDDWDLQKRKKALGGCCPKKCRSLPRYDLAKMVVLKQKRLQELKDKVHQLHAELAFKVADPVVAKRPLDQLVGIEATLEEAWRYIEDDKVRTVGLVGMGGIGKTALLTKINNGFAQRSHRYDLAIWITVSKPADLAKIQKQIWKKLDFPGDEWENTNETDRASKILAKMEQKTFLLFLDDIWEEIDISEIGVPSHNQSKVIFTTRSEDVCRKMRANKVVEVGILAPDKAFELFQEKVGRDTLSTNPEILRLAKDMAKQCKGLPLALKTVGGAMAGERDLARWKRSIKVVKQQQSEISRIMKDKVLAPLRFSYDRLPDDTHKKCFLYCALYPEDFEINTSDLIELWIGEGYLDEYGAQEDARTNGEDVIECLKRSYLLESAAGSYRSDNYFIKMHDVIREMALWMSGIEGKKIVCEERPSFTADQCRKWVDADKLSLWHLDDQIIVKWSSGSTVSSISGLSTLLLRSNYLNSKLSTIPTAMFSSVPSLRVLDLSWNLNLRNLPEGIGRLINLRYLNLSGTRIKIPEELRSLSKLVVLILSLVNLPVPEGIISSLSSLRVFRLTEDVSWGLGEDDEVQLIEELGVLTEIVEVSLSLDYDKSARQLLRNNSRLRSCLRDVRMGFRGDEVDGKPIQLNVQSLDHLATLELRNYECPEIKICLGGGEEDEESFQIPRSRLNQQDYRFTFTCLRIIRLFSCDGELQDVTALMYCTPNLEQLSIEYCSAMREVIRSDIEEQGEEVTPIFSRLTHLYLESNEHLKSIYRRALPFPSLQEIVVDGCPVLKKLPLDSKSCGGGGGGGGNSTLQRIGGEEEWWDGLEWDHDPGAKHIFTPKFHQKIKMSFLRYPRFGRHLSL